ncbi:MAG: hypothetical protein ACT4OY_00915 [Alphaproteobacteria bacterium]
MISPTYKNIIKKTASQVKIFLGEPFYGIHEDPLLDGKDLRENGADWKQGDSLLDANLLTITYAKDLHLGSYDEIGGAKLPADLPFKMINDGNKFHMSSFWINVYNEELGEDELCLVKGFKIETYRGDTIDAFTVKLDNSLPLYGAGRSKGFSTTVGIDTYIERGSVKIINAEEIFPAILYNLLKKDQLATASPYRLPSTHSFYQKPENAWAKDIVEKIERGLSFDDSLGVSARANKKENFPRKSLVISTEMREFMKSSVDGAQAPPKPKTELPFDAAAVEGRTKIAVRVNMDLRGFDFENADLGWVLKPKGVKVYLDDLLHSNLKLLPGFDFNSLHIFHHDARTGQDRLVKDLVLTQDNKNGSVKAEYKNTYENPYGTTLNADNDDGGISYRLHDYKTVIPLNEMISARDALREINAATPTPKPDELVFAGA